MKRLLNRLWVRLSLAFILVTQLSVLVVVVLADHSVTGEFRRYVFYSSASQTSATLVRYYNITGSWNGIDKVLAPAQANTSDQSVNTTTQSSAPAGGVTMVVRSSADALTCPPLPPLMLADAQGKVIYDSKEANVGFVMKGDEQAQAVPINGGTTAGKPLGYFLPEVAGAAAGTPGIPGQMDNIMINAPEQVFLDRIHTTLSVVAVGIGALGVLMGLIIAETLVAPLTNLSTAARAFAGHDWTTRVKERGASEIAAVARAFNAMADELQRAETLRRNLIADIAHELRTPLTVMQANLMALLDGIYPLDQREIATLYEETCVLNRLVDDLRELARADAGRLDLNLASVDVSAALNTIASKFSIAAESDGTQVVVEPISPTLCVQADADRLMQVLGNLFANAMRHTPGGSITLSAVLAPEVKGQPTMARVAITDTGDGITPEDLPHVFERFYRADKSRSRSTGSSGLGLSIARAWIEAMGGQIGVESSYGEGSRFWFTLPISSAETCLSLDKDV